MSSAAGHSHRATTKASNKAFKSRKATKGQIRDAAKGMTHAGSGAFVVCVLVFLVESGCQEDHKKRSCALSAKIMG